jgi:trans-aconitate 2-methyltransferase
VATAPWAPAQYLKFEDQRTRPARDLLAAVPLSDPRRIVDIGCGPGNSTELLVRRYPDADVIGLDSSAEMLAAARTRLPGVGFVLADITTWTPEPDADLLYSNATFQWVPDHLAVLERLFVALPPGAVLAVQMPDHLDGPSHTLMRTVAAAGPWAEKFAEPIRREEIHPPAVYYDRLRSAASRIDIWHSIYLHPMPDAAAIVAMVSSTGLRPFLARLDASEQAEYLRLYEAGLADAYPRVSDGFLFRFPRLFVVAVRK